MTPETPSTERVTTEEDPQLLEGTPEEDKLDSIMHRTYRMRIDPSTDNSEHFNKDADTFHPTKSNIDLEGLPSQLWLKSPEEIDYFDKAFFAVLKTISGLVCDGITQALNKVHIENNENFTNLLNKKSRKDPETGETRGLLTMSNHLHYVDDPLLLAAMIEFRYLLSSFLLVGVDSEYENWKWTPAEKRNFFYNPNQTLRKLFRTFFGRTKTVPILRGLGLEQIAFRKLEEFLQRGDWVHVFGEGTRTREYGRLNDFKPGPGKLIKNAPNTVVIPFGHDGLQEAFPWGASKEVYQEFFPEEHRLTGVIRNIIDTNHKVKSLIDEQIQKRTKGKFNLERVIGGIDHVFRNVVKTRKNIQIVVGEPMDLSELAAEVPDTPEGYMIISNAIRDEIEKLHIRAMELNRERKSK